MLTMNIMGLISMVIVGVFIPNSTLPLVVLFVNRILFFNMDPVYILFICFLAGGIGNIILWVFDEKIHYWLENKFGHKKPHHRHKQGYFIKLSKKIMSKIAFVKNPIFLFFTIVGCSFSFVPDVMTLELARKRVKSYVYIFAISLGKIVVYAPIIWGSIGLWEIIKNNI